MRRHDGAPSAPPTSTILAGNDFRCPCLVISARNAHRLPRWMIYAALCLTALASILASTWWVYHPGLSGDFLFDDFGNLPVLGATGPVTNWATFWRYITSGSADPTGRPLPLLTFLIDAHNWPANPYPFKVTNVTLHLINGALLAWVLWWLGKTLAGKHMVHNDIPPALRAGPLRSEGGENRDAPSVTSPPSAERGIEGDGISTAPTFPHATRATLPAKGGEEPIAVLPPSERRGIEGNGISAAPASPRATRATLPAKGGESARWPAIAALFGAGAWLLHPLLVSTTLYIVQREAMLAATFVLLGTLGWIASREALAHGHVKRAFIGMALSAWFCTGLAVLSKANGALFPLELLLVEWIVLARRPMPDARTAAWHKRAVIAFLIVPSALVIAYLLYLLPGVIHGTAAVRGWTIGERLMTEPRVVTDYLRLLFIPHAHSSGLFNDAFSISTGWLHPASTIPCTALILALIGAGFALRRRHPAIALALLFYFTAQLMESGWIPLELYYEHRNYLPAMLLFWPIGIGLARLRHLRWLGILAAACILLVLGVLTRQRATLWGDGFHQAQVWAAINPDSARAQANAALYDLSHDRPRIAAARLKLSLAKHPNDIQAPINLIGAECRLGGVGPQTLAAADHALANTRLGGQAAFKWFNDALGMAAQRTCAGLDFAALQTTLNAARRNPHWQVVPGRQQDLAHLQGELDLAEDKPNAALASFNRALAMQPNPGSALEQAAYLGSHGYPQLGLAHLDYYATLPPASRPGVGMPRIHAWVLRKQGWWPQETAYLRKNLASDATVKADIGKPGA